MQFVLPPLCAQRLRVRTGPGGDPTTPVTPPWSSLTLPSLPHHHQVSAPNLGLRLAASQDHSGSGHTLVQFGKRTLLFLVKPQFFHLLSGQGTKEISRPHMNTDVEAYGFSYASLCQLGTPILNGDPLCLSPHYMWNTEPDPFLKSHSVLIGTPRSVLFDFPCAAWEAGGQRGVGPSGLALVSPELISRL